MTMILHVFFFVTVHGKVDFPGIARLPPGQRPYGPVGAWRSQVTQRRHRSVLMPQSVPPRAVLFVLWQNFRFCHKRLVFFVDDVLKDRLT